MSSDSQVIRVTSKGQATIPKHLRDDFNIQAPGRVRMKTTADGILIEHVPTPEELAGDMADMTDDQGRTPMEVLRAGRRADTAHEDRLGSSDSGPDGSNVANE
jgi:antitoxin PrlF